MTVQEAISTLLQATPLQLEQPIFGPGAVTWINPPSAPGTPLPAEDFVLRRYVMAWWVHEALHDTGARHKIMFFLHQYLAVTAESGSSAQFFDYLSLLRWGIDQSFRVLVAKMVTDNCMLNYINNNLNFVNNPNENFAREFLELHTIGKGDIAGPGDYSTYTETDIVQAARVLTGFGNAQRHLNADPDTGIPAGKAYPQSHDFQPKTFSARFNGTVIQPPSNDAAGMRAELDAFIDMVFAQEATARNICRRLYRYYVKSPISEAVESDIIGPLAQTFTAQQFQLIPVLEQLWASQHFFDEDDDNSSDEAIGALIKSPLELALQALSFFEVPIPHPVTDNDAHYNTFYNSGVLERMLARTGMELFYPPDVAGYPPYFQEPVFQRYFFNAASIVGRYKLPQILLTGTHAWAPGPDQPLGTKLDLPAWLLNSGNISDPSDATVLVSELLQYLFPEAPDEARRHYFLDEIFLNGLPLADWTMEWSNYAVTGDDSEVKIPLSRLLNAIMYAPEYQIG